MILNIVSILITSGGVKAFEYSQFDLSLLSTVVWSSGHFMVTGFHVNLKILG